MSPEIVSVLVAAVVLVLLGVLFAVTTTRGRRWADAAADPAEQPSSPDPSTRPRAAVVVNPTKFETGTDDLRRRLQDVCDQLGWGPLLWLETTEDDPGLGQTREALRQKVDLVVACGGDGTVRTVAQELADSGTPMGLVPAGTGNLLARNLDMDPVDLPESLRIALTGVDRPVDVGWITVIGAHGEVHARPEEQAFLVMAGMGFDAAIMANVPEALKARVGPIAYAISGLRQLRGKQTRVRLQVDDGPPVSRRVRTVVVGNCGRLLGGLVLLPDAEVDDGELDVVSISPRGLSGWAAVAVQVISRRRRGHRRVEYWRGRSISIRAETPQPAQLDGDPVGDARELRMRVGTGALLVRVAADSAQDVAESDRARDDRPREQDVRRDPAAAGRATTGQP